MNNTIETAKAFCNKYCTNIYEVPELMFNYHNAIIQSKILELEKKLNTDDVIEQYRIEELINFLKEMQNESI